MAALRALVPELEAQGRALLAANRVDAEDRPGKQGGAICLPSRLAPPASSATARAEPDLYAERSSGRTLTPARITAALALHLREATGGAVD